MKNKDFKYGIILKNRDDIEHVGFVDDYGNIQYQLYSGKPLTVLESSDGYFIEGIEKISPKATPKTIKIRNCPTYVHIYDETHSYLYVEYAIPRYVIEDAQPSERDSEINLDTICGNDLFFKCDNKTIELFGAVRLYDKENKDNYYLLALSMPEKMKVIVEDLYYIENETIIYHLNSKDYNQKHDTIYGNNHKQNTNLNDGDLTIKLTRKDDNRTIYLFFYEDDECYVGFSVIKEPKGASSIIDMNFLKDFLK